MLSFEPHVNAACREGPRVVCLAHANAAPRSRRPPVWNAEGWVQRTCSGRGQRRACTCVMCRKHCVCPNPCQCTHQQARAGANATDAGALHRLRSGAANGRPHTGSRRGARFRAILFGRKLAGSLHTGSRRAHFHGLLPRCADGDGSVGGVVGEAGSETSQLQRLPRPSTATASRVRPAYHPTADAQPARQH